MLHDARAGVLATLAFALHGCTGSCPAGGAGDAGSPDAHVVRREAQPFPGSGPAIGVRRPPPADDGDPGLLEAVRAALGSYDGPVAYLGERAEGDARFGPLEARIRPVDAGPFEARDSADALAALEAMGAGYLIVSALDPPIAPWPNDRDNTLRVLLRDGVPPPRFQPVAIGRAHVVYRIGEPARASEDEMRALTAWVRALLAGGRPGSTGALPAEAPLRAPDGSVRVLLSLRAASDRCSDGREIVRALGEGSGLEAALSTATAGLRRGWSRGRGRSSCSGQIPARLEGALDGLALQVELVHRMAAITDRTPERLYYLVALGREGLWLQRGGQTWMVGPAQTVQRAVDHERALAERVGTWNGQPGDAWRDPAYGFGRFESVAWTESAPGGDPLPLYRGLPLVRMADLTRESLVEGLVLGARFLASNQEADGEYRYLYRPLRAGADRWTKSNNIVRHSLCPLVVLRAHQLEPDPALLESARRGIGYTMSHLRRQGDRCHVWYQDDGEREPNAKMGTVAALVLSILELGRSADISEYRDELECLGNQIVAMLGDDGIFVHYDVPPGHPSHGRHNTIYPGELMLALARLHEWSGQARYREAFDRAMNTQRSWFLRLSSERTEDGIFNEQRRVDLISFEPWGIMAVDDMHRQTGEARYADFAFELADFVDGNFQFGLDRAQHADFLGGYFKTQQELPAINSCGYTEGAAAAYAIALRSGRNVEERRLALLLGVRFVMQLQYHPARSLFHLPDPEAAVGGFRYNLSFSRVRNDYMYHAMNALALAAATLRPEDYPARVRYDRVPEILAPAFEGLAPPGDERRDAQVDGGVDERRVETPGVAADAGDAGRSDGGPGAD